MHIKETGATQSGKMLVLTPMDIDISIEVLKKEAPSHKSVGGKTKTYAVLFPHNKGLLSLCTERSLGDALKEWKEST